MAVGKSHRIVIEVDPSLKAEIYLALKKQGKTLKEWFIERAIQDLLEKGSKNGES